MKVLANKALEDNQFRELVQVRHPYAANPLIVEAIKRHPSVSQVVVVAGGRNWLVLIVDNVACTACTELDSSGCLVEKVIVSPSGTVEWRVVSASSNDIRELLSRLQERGCDPQITIARRARDAFGMTPRQREVLLAAARGGYFDTPRRTTLKDLAKGLAISKAGVGQTLKRALRTVLVEVGLLEGRKVPI